MYISNGFIDMGLEDGQEWPSPFHKKVATICLIQNPLVFTREKLMKNVAIINSLEIGYLQCASVSDLLNKGCDFI